MSERRSRHPKPTTEEKMGRLVRKAAQIIEDKGWIQGGLGSDEGGFCMDGALQRAVGMHPSEVPLHKRSSLVYGLVYVPNALAEFADQTHTALAQFLEAKGGSVWCWNDAEGRTKEEVLLYMRKFADEKDPQRP